MGVFQGVCLCTTSMSGAQGRQKKASGSSGLELQMLVSHRVGARNWTQFFWRAASALNCRHISLMLPKGPVLLVFHSVVAFLFHSVGGNAPLSGKQTQLSSLLNVVCRCMGSALSLCVRLCVHWCISLAAIFWASPPLATGIYPNFSEVTFFSICRALKKINVPQLHLDLLNSEEVTVFEEEEMPWFTKQS